MRGWIGSGATEILHGTFLRNRQFHRLFIKGKGIAPAQLAQATMALLIALASDPKRILDVSPDNWLSKIFTMLPALQSAPP